MTKENNLDRDEADYSEYLDWLNTIKGKDDEFFALVQEIHPVFYEYIQRSKHKNTVYSLVSFQTRLNLLKNAIFDLSESGNLYSIRVIYRVYLEHWMKGTYIWSRYLEEKNDDVGIEYKSMGLIGENIKYGNSINQVSKMLDAESKDIDVWDLIYKNSNDASLDEKVIKSIIKKFEYKSIAKYLIDKKVPGSDWVKIIIPEYSELSSYVHGGPDASLEYTKDYGKQYLLYKGMIKFVFNTNKIFSYIVFSLMSKDVRPDNKDAVTRLIVKLSQLSRPTD